MVSLGRLNDGIDDDGLLGVGVSQQVRVGGGLLLEQLPEEQVLGELVLLRDHERHVGCWQLSNGKRDRIIFKQNQKETERLG